MSHTLVMTRTTRLGSKQYGPSENVVVDSIGACFSAESIPASTTDKRFGCSIDASQITAMLLYASGALTIKTNSSGAPTQTFTMAAGQCIQWKTGEGTCPITADVTDLYVTNAAGSPFTFDLFIGYDNTP